MAKLGRRCIHPAWLAQKEYEHSLGLEGMVSLGRGYIDGNEYLPPAPIIEDIRRVIEKHHLIPRKNDADVIRMICFYENIYVKKKYSKDNICLIQGVLEGVQLAIKSLLGKGDISEFIIPLPSYGDLIKDADILGGKLVTVQGRRDNEFIPNVDDISSVFNKNTAAILLTQPGNPTCNYMPQKELERLINLAMREGIWVIIDESGECFSSFRRITYHPKTHRLNNQESDGLGERARYPINLNADNVIRLRSFSKEIGFAKYRYGYAMAHPYVISVMLEAKAGVDDRGGYSGSNIINDAIYRFLFFRAFYEHYKSHLTDSQIADKLAEATTVNWLTDRADFHETVNQLRANEDKIESERAYFIDELKGNIHITDLINPEGLYNVLCRTEYHGGSMELFRRLRDEKLLSVYPGTCFGLPDEEGWIRLTYANTHRRNEEGLKRLFEFLSENNRS